MQKISSISVLIRNTASFVKEHFLNLFILSSIPVALEAVAKLIDLAVENNHLSGAMSLFVGIVALALAFLILFCQFIFAFAIQNYVAKSYSSRSVWIAIKNTFKSFWSVVWVSILTTLICFGLFPTIILPLFIFPIAALVIPLYFITEIKGLDVFARLAYIIKGNYWKVFGRFLLITLINTIIVLIFGVITYICLKPTGFNVEELIRLAPYIAVAVWPFKIISIFVMLYSVPYSIEILKQLLSIKPENPADQDIHLFRSWAKGLSIWGLVVWVGFIIIWIIGAAFAASGFFSTASKGNTYSSQNTPILYTANDKTYKDVFGRFTIKYPDTWELVEENPGSNQSTFFIAPLRSLNSSSRGSVAITRFQVNGYTLEQLGQQFENEINSEKDNVKNDRLISVNKIKRFDTDVIQFIREKIRSFDNGNTYFTQVSEENMLIKNGHGYNVAYKNNSVDYQTMKPIGTKVLESLVFGK